MNLLHQRTINQEQGRISSELTQTTSLVRLVDDCPMVESLALLQSYVNMDRFIYVNSKYSALRNLLRIISHTDGSEQCKQSFTGKCSKVT